MKTSVEQPTIAKKLSFEDIPLELPDVFRGQYFIESLEKESKHLISFLNTGQLTVSSLEALLKPFFSSLAEGIDQMILPVITHEMAIANAIGTLRGEDGKARYESFFVDGGEYTSTARSIPLRYSCLFKMTDTVIQSTLKSALDCLVHLMHDLSLLKENMSGVLDFLKLILQPFCRHQEHRICCLLYLLSNTSGDKYPKVE
jgi:lantibiotic modifying enzyme